MGNLVVTPPGFTSVINWATLAANVANLSSLRGLLGPWRPPQWNQPQLYSITVMQVTTTGAQSNILFGTSDGNVSDVAVPETRQNNYESVTYFFDAVLRAEHVQELTETRHPVQTGASLIDHAYLNPAVVTLQIGMSDCMGRFASNNYTSASSKSISAYLTFKSLQKARQPITLATRLDTYENMLIRRVQAFDDKTTKFGLRAEITFVEILSANLATTTVPARADQTQTTNEGTKTPLTPSPVTANLLGKWPQASF